MLLAAQVQRGPIAVPVEGDEIAGTVSRVALLEAVEVDLAGRGILERAMPSAKSAVTIGYGEEELTANSLKAISYSASDLPSRFMKTCQSCMLTRFALLRSATSKRMP